MSFKKPKRPKSINEYNQSDNPGKLNKWSKSLITNVEFLKDLFDSDDFVVREIVFGKAREYRAAVCYFDGLVDRRVIHTDILQALMLFSPPAHVDEEFGVTAVAQEIKDHAITIGEITAIDRVEDVIVSMESGETAILIDGADKALYTNTRGWPARGISSPENENVVRGPREGFVETLRFNTALIRRWIRDPKLRLKMHRIGKRTKTDIGVMYIEGVVDPRIVKRVNSRLKNANNQDAIMADSQIEEILEDQFLTIFPTIEYTQRPDKVAASLLEGRVAIVVDRTPQVLMVPTTLPALLQSSDDYYNRWPLALIFRLIRWIGLIMAIYVPSLYVSLASYNPELIPVDLLLRMAGARAQIPFPVVVEVLILELGIEILREASIRLPSALGSTIGIVGGFVLGSAAVEAGLVSPIMVIIVAITALASYTLPDYGLSIAVRAIRFPMLLASGVAGLYGVVVFTLFGLTHLCSLQSLGISYMASIAPFMLEDQKDVFLRVPFWAMLKRPKSFKPQDETRKQGAGSWWSEISKKVVQGMQGAGKTNLTGTHMISTKGSPEGNSEGGEIGAESQAENESNY